MISIPPKMQQHRHIIILDVPADGAPSRGDIEMAWLFDCDTTVEQVLTLTRPTKFPDDYDGYELEKMIPAGDWWRDEGMYAAENPKEAFDKNTLMIETLEETIRFLKTERLGLLEKATAYAIANAVGIKPKITDF